MRAKISMVILLVTTIITLYLVITFTNYLIKRSTKEAFKKLYNNYSQILEMTVNDFDGNTECYFSIDADINNDFSGCKAFYEKFIKHLKISKTCNDNSLSNGCLPLYKKYNTDAACEGFSETMMNKNSQTYVMKDKSTLTIFNLPANEPKPVFAIDTNGKMNPNKPGHDLFSFVIVRNKSGNYKFHPNVIYCLPAEEDGIHQLEEAYQ